MKKDQYIWILHFKTGDDDSINIFHKKLDKRETIKFIIENHDVTKEELKDKDNHDGYYSIWWECRGC